jgi:hypothetical protein
MVAKKYAISATSAAIALRYGANVSRGIKEIEKKMLVQSAALNGELCVELPEQTQRALLNWFKQKNPSLLRKACRELNSDPSVRGRK